MFGMAIAMMAPLAVRRKCARGRGRSARVVQAAAGKSAITPGLGDTPKIETINVKLPLVGCTGTGGVKSGTSTGTSVGTAKTSFATFFKNPKSANVTTTIKWNTGTTSTYTAVTKLKAGAKVLTAIRLGQGLEGHVQGQAGLRDRSGHPRRQGH